MRAKVSSRAILLPALALFSLPGFGQPPQPTPAFGQQGNFPQGNFGQGPNFPTQELTLFQDDGRGPQGGPQSAEAGTPGVIVKGIYRFGDTYHVSLQSGEGGAVQQFTWQRGQSQPPVFNGYQIQDVDTRNVMLALPPGMSCQPNPQFGGNCVSRNQMSVTFAQTEPLRRNNNQRTNNNNNNRNNNNNNRAPWDQNQGNGWWTTQNGTDVRSLIEAARANPNGPERAQVEALLRERGGRGNFNNNNNNNNTGGRGGRGGGGGFNNNNNNNTGGGGGGGRGGGGGGRGGGGGFGN